MKTVPKEYKIEGRDPTIFRVIKNKENPYVMVDRRPIDNPQLSYKAKGILTYLLSRPDGWEVNVPDLVNHGIDGPAAIRTGLKELRNAGHIRYNPHREGGYIKKWVIEVYELPNSTEAAAFLDSENRNVEDVLDADFLQVENLQVGNRREVLSTLSSKNKKSEATTTTGKPANIFEAYEQNIGALTPLISDALKDHEATYSEAWVISAITEAAKMNARNLKYIEGILKGYKQRGSPAIGRTPVRQATSRRGQANGMDEYAQEAGLNGN